MALHVFISHCSLFYSFNFSKLNMTNKIHMSTATHRFTFKINQCECKLNDAEGLDECYSYDTGRRRGSDTNIFH